MESCINRRPVWFKKRTHKAKSTVEVIHVTLKSYAHIIIQTGSLIIKKINKENVTYTIQQLYKVFQVITAYIDSENKQTNK